MKRNAIQRMNNDTPAVAGAAPFYMPVAERRFTDKKGYAQHLGLCERTVTSLIAKGLPCLRIGTRRVRIDVPEADTWMRRTFGT